MSTYNWNAQDYEKHSQAQQKWARELINKLSLQGTEDILDLGCGDGKVTAEIAQSVCDGSVIGVDNSASMVKLAAERYPAVPNLTFQVMDASHLRFDECFDVVFSNAALHWIKNHQPVVEGLYRSLKPRGKILLQMGGKGNAGVILSVLSEIQAYQKWQPYFENFEFPYGFFGVEEYESMLLNSGFKINRVELIQKKMEHAGNTGLEGWIRTTWLPYTERVPEEKREKFIEAISEKYIERVPMDTEGRVHVAMIRIEVEAEKIA
ncbi:SAM-dependent methyltransferase [Candidatus Thiomargarita nelsonii]|uniref:SAM-dependent methyltransferase n=1 Tax=Candidatus Thiomargarita nelsonii TaxID=1003181 RepID=A0A0A6P3M6_9GAMM|nr:SAM-dependent methyltransferase [Candidatus Thiomargarita nelsonii]